jgi:hypothetical protein
MLDLEQEIFALSVCEKQSDKFLEFAGDVIVSVEVGVIKNFAEDVAREQVLNHHFANIGIGNIRIDFGFAEFKEFSIGFLEGGFLFAEFINFFAKCLDDFGNIGFEVF